MPVLFVYRAEAIPDPAAFSDMANEIARENGFDGLYLISMQNNTNVDPRTMKFNAATEFASANMGKYQRKNIRVKWLGAERCGVSMYKNLIKFYKNRRAKYTRFKCVNLGWDNTPRCAGKGHALVGVTPELFGKFVKNAVHATMRYRIEPGFLLVNAWNEWGESTHLEPDEKFGYQWLEQLKANLPSS
jgi:hypothetical protein